jgi:hypothetical protein
VLCDRRGAVAATASASANGLGGLQLRASAQRRWEDNLLEHLRRGEFSCVRKLVGLLVGVPLVPTRSLCELSLGGSINASA